MGIIKAKPTSWNGYNFRSRTEARWAVFLSELGIKFHYEHEDFMTPYGRYLPDFYLPDYGNGQGVYLEVKGSQGFTEDERKKCEWLCKHTTKDVAMLDGPPDLKTYNVFIWSAEHEDITWETDPECTHDLDDTITRLCECPIVKTGTKIVPGRIYETESIFSLRKNYGDRFFYGPGTDVPDEYEQVFSEKASEWYYQNKGVMVSRGAQFEFLK